MGIIQLTSLENIKQRIEAKTEAELTVVLRRMARIGEQVVTTAKNLPSPRFPDLNRWQIPPHQPNYMDWSKNLRSSIGYGVIRDGGIWQDGGFDRGEGTTAGRQALLKLAAETGPGRIALIVIAGMNYARYVSNKGYDVLDSSYLEAKRIVPQMLKQLGYIR